MTGPVVVGLDGSPASVTAAWWAAREAVDRRLPLLLLHSWTTQPLNVPVPQEALSKQRYGGQVLRRTEAELLHRHPGLTLTTELVSDPAAEALLAAGETASLLVLGSRGHGSVASFLLGSISLHVLGLAHCPAVVVRAGDPAVPEGWRPSADDRGDIVVGVQQNGPTTAPLLEFALTTAQLHRARVLAVRALPVSSLMTHPHALTEPGDEAWQAAEHGRLGAELAPWREKFPDVELVQRIDRGAPAQVLLAASQHSRLTVVGRRRHPSRLTWKLGPVAHAALHHMPCPVAVVPHD
ncbi:universal stress protein [Streptomyces justiciae]|uniref:Universal stress protein n=1 Tax=Streptomyces justiciae TaxID=2780140 RepID=A0ABU3LMT2_9ACTN|nr:universal stress protein [Streptomyces justiciae]MDT7839943.1 universal stress protein [Streptomyces justiciae]